MLCVGIYIGLNCEYFFFFGFTESDWRFKSNGLYIRYSGGEFFVAAAIVM